MSCCSLKHTFSIYNFKFDSIAQWESARLGTLRSWVRILFWAKIFTQIFFRGAKWGPEGGF